MRTKGQIEAEISRAIIRFEKEFMGRGPLETKCYLLDDLVLIRMKGILTQAEKRLATSENSDNGREQIKTMRRTLLENGRPLLEQVIQDILRVDVCSMHADLSTRSDERVIIFTLKQPPETDSGETVSA